MSLVASLKALLAVVAFLVIAGLAGSADFSAEGSGKVHPCFLTDMVSCDG